MGTSEAFQSSMWIGSLACSRGDAYEYNIDHVVIKNDIVPRYKQTSRRHSSMDF